MSIIAWVNHGECTNRKEFNYKYSLFNKHKPSQQDNIIIMHTTKYKDDISNHPEPFTRKHLSLSRQWLIKVPVAYITREDA